MDRRSLQTFLFSLALLIKVLAPFAAASAMAAASADSLFATPICSDAADAGHERQGPSAPHHDHNDCCRLCQCCHAHSIIESAPEPLFVVARNSIDNFYADRLFLLRVGAAPLKARARAPPSFS